MSKYRFLDDLEKENHFFKGSEINKSDWPSRVKTKVYENAELLVYTYRPELEIIGMFKVVSFGMNGSSLYVTLINKRTYQFINIGCVPKRLPGYKIICNLAARIKFERTVKVNERGYNPIYGNATAMDVRFKSHPSEKEEGHHYTVPVYSAEKFLGAEELNEAYRRLEDGIK